MGIAIARNPSVAKTGIDQIIKVHCQLSFTAGITNVSVIATGRTQPAIIPLEYAAVPKPIRDGSHCRTITGKAGWVMAMPALITAVAANRIDVVEARPRNAPPKAVTSRPTNKARNAPIDPTTAEPGSAAAANRIMGMPDNAPISVPDILRSVCINGISGGIARTGIRIAAPVNQSIALARIKRFVGTGTGL